MKYLLDANAWIGHLRQTAPEVTRKLGMHPRKMQRGHPLLDPALFGLFCFTVFEGFW